MSYYPKHIQILLDELERHGFANRHLNKLMKEQCDLTKKDRDHSTMTDSITNGLLQRRLELVLNAFKGGGFTNRDAFDKIVEAVIIEIPA